jgi:hypothetical protein
MSITTANDVSVPAARRGRSVFGRIADAMVASRKRQADRVVAGYLLGLDDDTLSRLGYDRRKLERRDPAGYPFL